VNLSISLDDLWTPLPTQAAFLDAIKTAPPLTIPAYIGAVGSGKSSVVCRAALGLALAYPHVRGLVGRFNFTELRDTTLATWFDLIRVVENAVRDRLPPSRRAEFPGLGTFTRGTGDYHFFNGATIFFRHLEDGHRRFKSLEIGFFGIDEASEVEGDQPEPPTVLMLQARLRQKGAPLVGFLVSNPTGFDHWLYRWYGEGVSERYGVGRKGWPIFRTNTRENRAALPPDYEPKLRQSYPASWIQRYLEGEWGGIDEGAPVFPEFDRALHIRPVEWIKRRPVHVGIDLGYNAPGVVWAQVDPVAERLHVLYSWDPKNLNVYRLAEGIQARNAAWFPGAMFEYYAGHDANARKDTNDKTSAQILSEYGLAPHVRLTAPERGFSVIRSLLRPREDTDAGLWVHARNGVLLEGFQGGYKYKKDKKDEVEKTDRYDPLMDALRYIAVNTFSTAGTLERFTTRPAFRGIPARTGVR
jgi:hypothetical protein